MYKVIIHHLPLNKHALRRSQYFPKFRFCAAVLRFRRRLCNAQDLPDLFVVVSFHGVERKNYPVALRQHKDRFPDCVYVQRVVPAAAIAVFRRMVFLQLAERQPLFLDKVDAMVDRDPFDPGAHRRFVPERIQF